MKEKIVVICDGNGDDTLGFARLAALWGNIFGKADYTTLRFGWRGQHKIDDNTLHLAYDQRYLEVVQKLEQLKQRYQEIVFVGISASAHLAILLLLNHRIDRAIAFDGILRGKLPRGNNSKLITTGLTRLQEKIATMEAAGTNFKNLTVVMPRDDNLIPIEQLDVDLPARRTTIDTKNHLVTTSFGMLRYVMTGKAETTTPR